MYYKTAGSESTFLELLNTKKSNIIFFSHMFLPQVLQPTRVTSNPKTLIYIIFSNILDLYFASHLLV